MQKMVSRPEKVYVKVTSVFDALGFMQPKEIIWRDGRVFPIEAVKDYRPASSISHDLPGDCFTIVIKGTERHLYFERNQDHFSGRYGRWFVETSIPTAQVIHRVKLY